MSSGFVQSFKQAVARPGTWLALALLGFSLGLLVWTNSNYIVPLKDLSVPNSANDFGVFWSGSKVILGGHNPYIYKPSGPFIDVVLAAGGRADAIEPFISPYYMSALFLVFTVFPLGLAASLWLSVLQILLATGVMLIIKATGNRLTPVTILLGIGLAMLWRYTFLVMMIGNISILLFFLIASSYYFSRNGQPYLGGGLAALLVIKPHVVFLTLPLLLLVPTVAEDGQAGWLNRQTYRRWRGFGLIVFLLLAYSFILQPGWVGDWLKLSNSYSNQVNIDVQLSSLRSSIALLIGDKSLVMPVLIGLAVPMWLAIVWLWWQNRANLVSFPYLIALAVCVCLLTSPYIRDYDSCMLLFGFLWCYFTLYRAEKERGQFFGWSWAWWLLVLLPFAVHLLASDEAKYAVESLVPLGQIVLIGLVWRRNTPASKGAYRESPQVIVG